MHRCLPFVLTLACFLPALQAEPRKPNVIVIYTDDQGTVDLNIYGAKDLRTPHMDALARSGVRFTQFYTAAPVCSPSRAAMLTGRFPQRAQLTNNAGSRPGQSGMPGSQVTMAEMFKAAGYATAHIGKWHLGHSPDQRPNAQGFDHSFGHMDGCIDNYSHFFYWNGPNRHDLWRNGQEVFYGGQFFPDLMLDEATAFMRRQKEKPFFMYFAINVPHYPYQGHDKWLEHYKDVSYPRNLYAAFVSSMDEVIGKLLANVDELGLRQDTIIVFQSDHGHSTEERAHGGGGSAGPYRGAKFSMFEGGIRIPAFISWPGHIPQDQVRDQLAVSVDWMPTLAELCGVQLPERKIDGRSIVPIFHQPDALDAHDVFHWQLGKQWAVRKGPWKLIGHPNDTSGKAPIGPSDALFLVNLDEDATEMKNIAADNPQVVQELQAMHEAWAKNAGEQ